MKHSFHIPVMGTCYTADSPIRLAHLGFSTVISLVDDILLERLGSYYAKLYKLPYATVPKKEEGGRAERIKNYLNLVDQIVKIKMDKTKAMNFNGKSDKDRYFKLLPTKSPLRQRYFKMMELPQGELRTNEEKNLQEEMTPGSIDVNIMVKLDRPEYGDAKEALKGYAESDLKGNTGIVFSAGINQALYTVASEFKCFYRNAKGFFDKKIIVKISDFRSALVQGKFLARKGLEVSEFRIESGLNCGGHAFASQGELLPAILKEVAEKKDSLVAQFKSAIQKYYTAMGWDSAVLEKENKPIFSVQGGIGNFGEDLRLRTEYGMDRTGWGSPFMLVPEATLLDSITRKQLVDATEKDLFLSNASPLGVPFNNLHTCGAEVARKKLIAEGHPGAPCIKGFLENNTEFTERPICTASRQYQKLKTEQIEKMAISREAKDKLLAHAYEKTCLCHELGNAGLIELGLETPEKAPQAICPGPNIAYFNREYTLEEMVDHIYGRGKSLVPENRPHVFAQEIKIYVNWFKGELENFSGDKDYAKWLDGAAENLYKGMDLSLEVAQGKAYPGENLKSIEDAVQKYRPVLQNLQEELKRKAA
ncbi:MAG: hypothetical protein M0P13_06425 [Fibrobacteraceae bacterium]|nr:hypothetical protein [Fibrobacteraceae bacterium]